MSATAHLPQIAKIASIPKKVAYETITAAPSSPHIGAEIGNIDLTRPLSNKQVTELHDAFARYQVIFVNQDFTSYINGLPRLEGERVLQLLIDHCTKPEWTCRFRWTPHSIAFWDNRCTHHKAVWDYWPNVRSGYRVQVEGTEPPVAG